PVIELHAIDRVLDDSFEDHAEIKRRLAHLVKLGPAAVAFDARLDELNVRLDAHVAEEEDTLFPEAEQLLDPDQLIALAQEMVATMVSLAKAAEAPRLYVLHDTDTAGL